MNSYDVIKKILDIKIEEINSNLDKILEAFDNGKKKIWDNYSDLIYTIITSSRRLAYILRYDGQYISIENYRELRDIFASLVSLPFNILPYKYDVVFSKLFTLVDDNEVLSSYKLEELDKKAKLIYERHKEEYWKLLDKLLLLLKKDEEYGDVHRKVFEEILAYLEAVTHYSSSFIMWCFRKYVKLGKKNKEISFKSKIKEAYEELRKDIEENFIITMLGYIRYRALYYAVNDYTKNKILTKEYDKRKKKY